MPDAPTLTQFRESIARERSAAVYQWLTQRLMTKSPLPTPLPPSVVQIRGTLVFVFDDEGTLEVQLGVDVTHDVPSAPSVPVDEPWYKRLSWFNNRGKA